MSTSTCAEANLASPAVSSHNYFSWVSIWPITIYLLVVNSLPSKYKDTKTFTKIPPDPATFREPELQLLTESCGNWFKTVLSPVTLERMISKWDLIVKKTVFGDSKRSTLLRHAGNGKLEGQRRPSTTPCSDTVEASCLLCSPLHGWSEEQQPQHHRPICP